MNRRYIDFVPAKKGSMAKKPVARKVVVKSTPEPKPVKRITRKIPAANPLLDEEVLVEEILAVKEEPVKKPKKAPAMQPKFVKTEVKKRPLGNKRMAKKPAIKTATRPAARAAVASKPAVAPKTTMAPRATTAKTASTAKRPAPLGQRAKFLNTDKIQKRALGRTAARVKPVPVPKPEKPKAPEKIIAKPEKDSKAGLIIAIILTIILGAAAGTVAFLLLPK